MKLFSFPWMLTNTKVCLMLPLRMLSILLDVLNYLDWNAIFWGIFIFTLSFLWKTCKLIWLLLILNMSLLSITMVSNMLWLLYLCFRLRMFLKHKINGKLIGVEIGEKLTWEGTFFTKVRCGCYWKYKEVCNPTLHMSMFYIFQCAPIIVIIGQMITDHGLGFPHSHDVYMWLDSD